MHITKAVFDRARQNGSKIAFQTLQKEWTFLELENAAQRVSNGLKSLGVCRNDRVITVTRHHAQCLILVLAAAKIGAVCTPLNFRLNQSELYFAVLDAEAKFILFDKEFSTVDVQNIPSVMSEDVLDWCTQFDARDEEFLVSDNEIALQLYSSGTTGSPKGVLLTHDNLISNFEVFTAYSKFDATSVVLNPLPNCHIAGMSLALNATLSGGQSICPSHFDTGLILDAIQKFQVTHLFLVPTMIRSLLNDTKIFQYDLSSLTHIVYGGAPIDGQLLREARNVFQCGFIQTYGMTETTAGVVFLMPGDHEESSHSGILRAAGKALFGSRIKVVNLATLHECKEDEIGEVWIHSRKNMKGYWKAQQETSAAYPEGREDGIGWLRSGDLGYMRNGYLFVTGRIQDVIISGGEKIYPFEVESVLLGHEAVLEVAVLGVLDEKWGESVKAFVVLKNNTVSEPELIAFVRTHLSHFKCPKSIELMRVLPKTASGKISKEILRRKQLDHPAG